MTPGARIQELISIINDMDLSRGPADVYIYHYYKSRRYMGSKDRRWLSQGFFNFLRSKGTVEGLIRHHKLSITPRLQVMTSLILSQTMTMQEIQGACDGDRYAPKVLSFEETSFLKHLTPESVNTLSLEEQLSLPLWWVPYLQGTFGDGWPDEVRALNDDASLDLRVNTLKTTREEAISGLRKEGFNPHPTPFSSVGVRLAPRSYIMEALPYKNGEVEIQDEGSQLIAAVCEVKPGMAVLDLCAGAGGKTLALAAAMKNKGLLIGTDIVGERLDKAKQRLRKAGVHNATLHLLSAGDKWIKRHAARFDRVLVDAPCSGSGTWRRNPDLKWRVTEQDINELVDIQRTLLDQAAGLVKPGSQLIYSTCSLVKDENDEQISTFLERHLDFSVHSLAGFRQEVLNEKEGSDYPYVRLSPLGHKTDGFFVAVLTKKKEEEREKSITI